MLSIRTIIKVPSSQVSPNTVTHSSMAQCYHTKIAPFQLIRSMCSKKAEVPRNVLEPLQTGHQQSENGAIYDKKPFKITLDENKTYAWCLCGKSKTQPLCDGTHKNVHLKIAAK
jgi:Iron-binding zinc finger CDGSH type